MKETILINNFFNEIRVAILENSTLAQLFVERETEKHIYGNIYKGRVVNILPAMQAAFVNIGKKKNAFIHVSDAIHSVKSFGDFFSASDEEGTEDNQKNLDATIEDVLKHGQEIMVQIKKEGISEKGAKVTTNVTLPGRILVYLPNLNNIGISKRIIEKSQRTKLKKIISANKKGKEGFIIRTQAQTAKKQDIINEINFLRQLWGKIKMRFDRLPAPSLIYEDPGMVYRVVRDLLTIDTAKVWVDDREQFEKLRDFVKEYFPTFSNKLVYYNNKIPLFQYFKIEEQIEQALNNKLVLKSGAELILEQTESMTTIDINSAGFSTGKDFETFAFNINLEAAREIPKQLKLRDIGGIIIIDFIDMHNKENRKKILQKLQEELKKDKTYTKVYSFSPLGLVEMVRTRIKESIVNSLFSACPTCGGKGKIPSTQTIILKILRKLKLVCASSREKSIVVKLNPISYTKIAHDKIFLQEIENIENQYKKTITISSEIQIPAGEITVVSYKKIL